MRPERAESWFRVLCVTLALEQIVLFAFGQWLQGYVPPPESADLVPALRAYAKVLMLLAVAFAVLHLILAFSRRRPWLWVAGLTTATASVVCCPPGVLLLLVWLRPETKRHFGMPD